MIEELTKKCQFEFKYFFYADDKVFLVKEEHLCVLIKNLYEFSENYNLTINENKSGIFPVKNHKKINSKSVKTQKDICCGYLRYLGVLLNPNGDIANHLKGINEIIIYLKNAV